MKRWAFNVTDYYRLLDVGIPPEDTSKELITGDIMSIPPPTPRHAACRAGLNALFFQRHYNEFATIGVKHPVRLTEYTEPIPDLVLLRRRSDFYKKAHPVPSDVQLIVEIGDDFIDYDRDVMLPLYAQVNITEVWLVNLPANIIEVYNQPDGEEYQGARLVQHKGSFISRGAFGHSFDAEAILG
jgi:hypothetical protein